MGNKKITTAIISIISLLGVIYEITYEDLLKQITGIIIISLTILLVLNIINHYINISNAWLILVYVKKLGIKRIYIRDISKNFSYHMANAKRIRIMALSGEIVIKKTQKEIVSALVNNKAFIQVLLCEPNSTFVLDTDEIEGRGANAKISDEINSTTDRLNRYALESREEKREEEIGQIKVGYYTTHLRSSLVICDTDWGWLTFSLPPQTATQSISMELMFTENGLMSRMIKHFDQCWKIVEDRNNIITLPRP